MANNEKENTKLDPKDHKAEEMAANAAKWGIAAALGAIGAWVVRRIFGK